MKKVLSMLLVFCLLSTCVAMAEGGFTPGTYTGVGQGRNGEITVEVTLNVNIPARNTPRIRKDGNRKSGGWKLSLRSIGNLDSGYLETCLL